VKRFKFGLEKIHELRKYREQEARNELGKAIGALTEIENNIEKNAVKHSRAAVERFTGIGGGGSGGSADGGHAGGHAEGEAGEQAGAFSMMAWDNYILRLEQEAERLMEEAARAEIVVEEKRDLYLEASRELKVMEKLREKREKEYRKEVFAAETRERDDMYRPK